MTEQNNDLDNFKIYVTTYKKFNEGSLLGKWLTLTDYSDYNELLNAMKELHQDEKEPKFMFLNWKCCDLFVKLNLINKHYISKNIYDIITAIDDSGLNIEILEAFLKCFEETDIWEIIGKADDCYYGKFDNDIEFVQYLSALQEDFPVDFAVSNGHYFRRY